MFFPLAKTLGLLVALSVVPLLVRPAVAADPSQVYPRAVVAADHPAASQAGVAILKRGGNVIDAAVATAFTLSVVRPASSGLGGGGFLVFWNAKTQKAIAVDYRERAPARATATMFSDDEPKARGRASRSVHGGLAVAVPGEVAGLCQILAEQGTLPLATVLEPALELARSGVEVDDHEREVQAEVLQDFAAHPEYRARFEPLYRLYLNGGRPWKPGDRFHSPLAAVLERIARDGAAGFHDGEVAAAIVSEIESTGGIVSRDDLRTQRPVVREALSRRLGTGTLWTMPPPSSGGIALLETLNVLQAAEERLVGPRDRLAPHFLHLFTESLEHAFADRAEFLGDADFVSVPLARLTSTDYARALARRIDPQTTQPGEAYGRFQIPDDSGTTHFSILDADGNAVACTETINTLFGSYVVEPRFGVVLNNEMDDFTAHPGQPNAFGLQQGAANSIEPGKKPLSSMTPTIVVRDGKAEFVAGASGGPRIISATLQVLLGMSRFGLTPDEAVRAPRLHHQWMPRRLDVEPDFPEEIAQSLAERGHTIRRTDDGAVVQAAARVPGGVRGASDPRKHGRPAGY